MSNGINKAMIIGNLCQDPEVRHMANGDPVANVSIATNESWKDKNTGEKKERAEFHRVVFFGKLAEIVGQYLRKGSKVYIEGRLQTRKWQSKDGQDKYTTEIVVDMRGTMQMLDSKGSTSQSQAAPQQQQAQPQPQQRAAQAPPLTPQQYQQAQQQQQYVPQTPPRAPKQQQVPETGSSFDDDIPF